MKKLLLFLCPLFLWAELWVGIGKADITPPPGTPSAGYMERKGEGMEGVHDPLSALALYIDNGTKKIAFCSVDNLGFTTEIMQKIIETVRSHPCLDQCEIFVGSTHTHSGGGSYLNIPVVGAALAGPYNAELTQWYVDQTAKAIIEASAAAFPAKIGIGYGCAENLSKYRGTWPENITPLCDVAVIKITRSDGSPYAVLFNYPMHPTVMRSQNRLFSADFVGYARDRLQSVLDVHAVYFNGAQGDIIPGAEDNEFTTCEMIGKSLAQTVQKIWDETPVSDELPIETRKINYTFKPQATPAGLTLPVESYSSELNLIVLNNHAFVTIPGELSCVYDKNLKEAGKKLGYSNVSILGLTNDAHGYIITPDSWRHKTFESGLSFGGENYGSEIEEKVLNLLKQEHGTDAIAKD